MTQQEPSAGLYLTGNALVFWTLSLPLLWAASVLPGADTLALVMAFFFPWLVGVILLGVLYLVQR